jgi:hypothetical protein
MKCPPTGKRSNGTSILKRVSDMTRRRHQAGHGFIVGRPFW